MPGWSAAQYLKFEDERTRPARDLLAQVPLGDAEVVWDMGGGPGNSTELLVDRFGAEAVRGLDSDDDMLEKARKRLPDAGFDKADLSTWLPPEPPDLLYANAVFQWLPDHLGLLVRLMKELKPGGVLAIQMPDNLGEPSHLAMEETGLAGPWSAAFAGGRIRRAHLPSPAEYMDALTPVSSRVDVWHTIYYHPMANPQAIVEWVKGTGLRPYLQAAGAEHEAGFLADYSARIAKAYPPIADGRSLLKFPRLFIVAIRR
ncbi:trans-aconitate 2-methyltransferase [Ciceribacter sp. L1K22]|uniref:trans-aconitate 2-methyltransferase n=1 Tax=Ciceribacter sp. L1K22 TaxID=2820275 RepID=UPI001ABE9941|nr:trans-aconitate 2-methyltransferase [Ciceribacter sp. L1K22]MBO3759286.1 trans-aconitate 2-methyltransferase [Ciceribacter sp. L1K22]